MKTKPFRISATIVIFAIVSAAFVACGSNDTKVVAPQDVVAPVAAAVATTESTESVESEEAQVLVSASAVKTVETQAIVLESVESSAGAPDETNETAFIELKPVVDPATVQALQTATEPESTETALLTSYSDFGFSLKLDLGADVRTAGWTEPEPSITQGIIAFSYGGVNANLVWGPPQDRTALTFVADTYNVLRASQPSVTFESISDGDVSISDQVGVYGGFKAVDNSGAAIGGGLIGAWICGDSETAFRMTLTGEDATVVQLRFDRLLDNFACTSS